MVNGYKNELSVINWISKGIQFDDKKWGNERLRIL